MAKYDSKRKLERNEALVETYIKNNEWGLKEIGKVFEISPARVWQLIKEEEKKLGHKIVRTKDLGKRYFICHFCRRIVPLLNWGYCPYCGTKRNI